MEGTDFARVVAEFGSGVARLVDAGSSAAARVPSRWAAIADGRTRDVRRDAAVALWNHGLFVNLAPRFAMVLDECLDDVRVCLLRGDWVLLYGLRKSFQPPEFRIGWDPDTFGAGPPPYWDLLPEELRVFLTTVHAGFTDLDEISFGPTRPRDMATYRELNTVASVRNWDTGDDIPADRMVLIAQGLGSTRYFVSPDLPADTIGWEAGGNMDKPLDFARTFDTLISHGFRLERDRPPQATRHPTPDTATQARKPPPRVARAVAWNRELTEAAARARIHDLITELVDALGGVVTIRSRDGIDGGIVVPCDDDAGNVYQIDRIEARYSIDPPAPDRAQPYLPVIARIWEQRGWKVTVSTDADTIGVHARTNDWYELALALHDNELRLAVLSLGFHQPHRPV